MFTSRYRLLRAAQCDERAARSADWLERVSFQVEACEWRLLIGVATPLARPARHLRLVWSRR
jgi:hypothetical protein